MGKFIVEQMSELEFLRLVAQSDMARVFAQESFDRQYPKCPGCADCMPNIEHFDNRINELAGFIGCGGSGNLY